LRVRSVEETESTTVEFEVEGHCLSIEFVGIRDAEIELVGKRVDAYLRPRARELFTRLEEELSSPVPPRLILQLGSATHHTVDPSNWHTHHVHGERNGRRTVERLLVQVAAQSNPDLSDAYLWHNAACGTFKNVVDPTFICALALL
jgi:hypothetical protein